jgi:D-ribose pyranose/furanose isomerase RbsD
VRQAPAVARSHRSARSVLPGLERVPHEEFKAQVGHARFVVRTGEATPYANVLLRAGVPFLD